MSSLQNDRAIHSLYACPNRVSAIESKTKKRLLKVCYVPATSTGLPRLLFSAAAINSTNETNKAGGTRHHSILLRCLWLALRKEFWWQETFVTGKEGKERKLEIILYRENLTPKIFAPQDFSPWRKIPQIPNLG